MTHTQDHHYDQSQLHQSGGVVEGEEDHHEKKSIFKRVMAKAKKVKDSLASKAHSGHSHDQDDEEDDEHDQDQDREEIFHGGPTAKIFAMGTDENSNRASSGPTPSFQNKVTNTDSSVPALSAHEPVTPDRHGAEHSVNSGMHKSPLGVPLCNQPSEDVFLDTNKQPSKNVPLDTNGRRHEDVTPVNFQARGANIGADVGGHDAGVSHYSGKGIDNTLVEGLEKNKGVGGNVQSDDSDATVSGLEPPNPQSTYIGMLSNATTATKNAVASKLGYGGTTDTQVQESKKKEEDTPNVESGSDMDKAADSENAQSVGGITGYGKQIASTVAGAGSAILSKIPGIGMGTQREPSEDADIGATPERTTDKMEMGKSEEKKGVHEEVKDALHKCNTDEYMESEKMNVPLGKVTESEEVANRLGSSEEERTGKTYLGTGNESPSTGVVDKFKGAFTNWFGKGGEMNPSMAFNDQSTQPQDPTGEEDNVSREGERRLQAN